MTVKELIDKLKEFPLNMEVKLYNAEYPEWIDPELIRIYFRSVDNKDVVMIS